MLSILSEDLIFITDKNFTKKKILEKMTDILYNSKRIIDREKFYKILMEREKIQTTGIGEEVAIPHVISDDVKIFSLVICVSKKGINFNSFDKKPVRLIFLIAAPSEFTKLYLQVVAKISRIMKINRLRERLFKANDPKDVLEVFEEFDKIFPKSLKLKKENKKVSAK